MGFEQRPERAPIGNAGEYVEVIDPASKLHGKTGCVAFFVGDNIYVTFDDVRWSPTKMFFADQLRLAPAPARAPSADRAARFVRRLRMSLAKMRL